MVTMFIAAYTECTNVRNPRRLCVCYKQPTSKFDLIGLSCEDVEIAVKCYAELLLSCALKLLRHCLQVPVRRELSTVIF